MAGLAQILKESGHEVSGSDNQFYHPMSDYIRNIGIKTFEGYSKKDLPKADLYVIGNALSRGNESVEEILEKKLPFVSGPEMLGRELKSRDVFAVSGTHGKTTTSYMLAHIFRDQGKDVGYLIGGISEQFSDSAKLGTDKIFVIEADECFIKICKIPILIDDNSGMLFFTSFVIRWKPLFLFLIVISFCNHI